MAVLIPLIRLYRRYISPFLGPHCRYYPSCSAFAEEAITEHGLFRGSCMAFCRVLRCNPFFPGGYDPVPGKVNSRNKNNG